MNGNKKAKLVIVRERGDVIDFDERRKSMKATIKRDKANLELEKNNKYNIDAEDNTYYIDAITKLIYNLHLIEDGLKGQFDIVVFPEELY